MNTFWKNVFLVALVFFFISIFSCKKEIAPTSTSLNFIATNGGVEISKSGVIQDVDNRNFEFEHFNFYISNIKVTDENGLETSVPDIILYKLGERKSQTIYDIPMGKYKAISFSLGLDPSTNSSTPSSFSANHPLSLDQGMYWDMLKYRFLVMEGNVDDSPGGTGTPAFPFALHIGTDAMYRTVSLIKTFEVSDSPAQVDLPFEVNKIFYSDIDTLSLLDHYSNDSATPEQLEDGTKFMDNLANAFK